MKLFLRKCLVVLICLSFGFSALGTTYLSKKEVYPFLIHSLYSEISTTDNLLKKIKKIASDKDYAFFEANIPSNKQLPRMKRNKELLILSDREKKVNFEVVDFRRARFRVNGVDYHFDKNKNLKSNATNLMRILKKDNKSLYSSLLPIEIAHAVVPVLLAAMGGGFIYVAIYGVPEIISCGNEKLNQTWTNLRTTSGERVRMSDVCEEYYKPKKSPQAVQ